MTIQDDFNRPPEASRQTSAYADAIASAQADYWLQAQCTGKVCLVHTIAA